MANNALVLRIFALMGLGSHNKSRRGHKSYLSYVKLDRSPKSLDVVVRNISSNNMRFLGQTASSKANFS